MPLCGTLHKKCEEEEQIGCNWHPIEGIGANLSDRSAKGCPIRHLAEVEGIRSEQEERCAKERSLILLNKFTHIYYLS